MSPPALLSRLYELALAAARATDSPTVVEIGAYRGASTVALALGLREAGLGRIHSIDPHAKFTGILGGKFSPDDHAAYEATLQNHGVAGQVTHHCCTSVEVAAWWRDPVQLLWIDGDHSYAGVAADLRCWLPFVADGGVVVLDDHTPGSEVEAAVRDHVPFARFQAIERVGNALVLRRTAEPRTLILCGGMQSSGSTLVSMCFLQRDDIDGVYDLDNPVVQQDFARVFTDTVWIKMTVGSFAMHELVDLYRAQGWVVKPLLVQREQRDILASLASKWYGVDGATGDDPPLLLRLNRYLADLERARMQRWTVLNYEELIASPEAEVTRVCAELGLPSDDRMLTWPKSPEQFAYPSVGNESLRGSLTSGTGLLQTIARYKSKTTEPVETTVDIDALLAWSGGSNEGSGRPLLPPVRFRGTRRDRVEAELRGWARRARSWQLQRERLLNHVVFGPLLRFWKRFVNPTFPFGQ